MKTTIPRRAEHYIDAASLLLFKAHEITYHAHAGRTSARAKKALDTMADVEAKLTRLVKP